MANSYVSYIGNGSQTDYTVTFPYIDRSHVKLYVSDVLTTVTWVNDSVIRISPAPAESASILIKRVTPTSESLVDFIHGARLGEQDLDIAMQQILYALQEDIEYRGGTTDFTELESRVTVLESGKADTGHNHTGTYAPAAHTHDDRYFTEAEMTASLAGKAAATHTHVEADITDLSHDAEYICGVPVDDTNIADGCVLKYDLASDSLVYALDNESPGGSGITSVVEDTTPQLGGDLDMNGHNIQTVTPTEMAYVHGVTSAIQTQLDGKAATTHNHDSAYAAASHNQAISTITGLQTALDGKAAAAHDQAISTITGLQTALDGKAATSHNQAISTITDLQTTLDGKAASSHNHDERYFTETEVNTALAGKSDTTHNHDSAYAAASHSQAISTVTGLQTALDGKSATTHNHNHDDLANIPAANHREILYGTGDAPSASGHADGTLYFKHEA